MGCDAGELSAHRIGRKPDLRKLCHRVETCAAVCRAPGRTAEGNLTVATQAGSSRISNNPAPGSFYRSARKASGSTALTPFYLSEKISSIGSLKRRATLKARGRLGSYL